MRFGVLGPLTVSGSPDGADVRAAKQRLLLAMLLTRPGRPVSTDRLAEALWEGERPADVNRSVAWHVHKLRRMLGPQRIPRVSEGYLIEVGAGELDAARFEELCRSAGAPSDAARSSERLADALALWRGPAFGDLADLGAVREEATRLDALRLTALERRVEADLALGRQADLIGELTVVVGEHPASEAFRAQLMLALYRCGRQADALRVYQEGLRLLREEFGVRPGTRLRRLEQSILRNDPELDPPRVASPRLGATVDSSGASSWIAAGRGPRARDSESASLGAEGDGVSWGSAPAVDDPAPAVDDPASARPGVDADPTGHGGAGPAGSAVSAPRAVPAELPAPPSRLAGRESEADRLLASLGATPAAIGVITGLAGGGKSALAVHIAHRVAAGFPDGQLYVDLRGAEPGAAPAEPAAVLRRMLRSLGAAAPAESAASELSARLRSATADRRVLVVLDNARDAAQVRPLLPAGEGCRAIVTGRCHLAGLDGAAPLRIGVLAPADAREMLRGLLPEPADAETVARVAELCGQLPLALGVAAARLRHQPPHAAERFVERLASERLRLSLLRLEDKDVRASLLLGYERLDDPSAARMFRLLGAHPARDIDPAAAAALADVSTREAESTLETLVDASLLESHEPEIYRLNALLRLLALELSRDKPPPARD